MSDLLCNNHFHALGADFYTEVMPQGLTHPVLERVNIDAVQLIGLDPDTFSSQEFIQVFSGSTCLPGFQPLAHVYSGHQFGHFNPLLGDGRTILLGEVETTQGHWEISLKGAGKTPYARDADGLAGINECLHEYDCSQRLANLGVPVTACLCIVSGDQLAYRHSFERAAMLTRLAPSHIRFGTFEYHYFRRDHQALRRLADHVIERHYPECALPDEQRYSSWFAAVVRKTAQLVAHWQSVGFVHGMMNTDNQSILGISLDLSSSAFTHDFDPEYVSSSVDEQGLFAFGRQPVTGLWNCNVLAKALSPLIAARDLRKALLSYETTYLNHYETLTSSGSNRL